MARPQKIGLDYFPLDTDIDQDDKVAIIEAQHGMLGFSVVIKLLMKIYSEGYYYDWTEKEQILFSKRVNVDINDVNVIINDCVKWGLFDENLFNEYEILTSSGIQRRYFEAVKRRQKVEIAKEFLLLDDETVNAYNNISVVSINDDINEEIEEVNADINPQIKVKESKVNKIKEDKSKEKETKLDISNTTTTELEENIDEEFKELAQLYQKCGFDVTGMTPDWLLDLKDRYGFEWVKNAILEAEKQGARRKAYVEKILGNWSSWGGMKLSTDVKDTSQNTIVQAKKNRFHNFEQRSDKYTAEQLEEIGRKKMEKYLKKMKIAQEDGKVQ